MSIDYRTMPGASVRNEGQAMRADPHNSGDNKNHATS
jgi:hypothetical protein